MRYELLGPAILVGTCVSSATQPTLAQTYGFNDGQADKSIGLAAGDSAWFQSFDTQDMGVVLERVVEVCAVNGSAQSPGAARGSSGGIAICDDPDDDLDPRVLAGAHLMASATWVAEHAGTDAFELTVDMGVLQSGEEAQLLLVAARARWSCGPHRAGGRRTSRLVAWPATERNPPAAATLASSGNSPLAGSARHQQTRSRTSRELGAATDSKRCGR